MVGSGGGVAIANLTGRLSETGIAQTLKWSHENRLVEVKSSNLLTETYGKLKVAHKASNPPRTPLGSDELAFGAGFGCLNHGWHGGTRIEGRQAAVTRDWEVVAAGACAQPGRVCPAT
jgi:hypothetical protein